MIYRELFKFLKQSKIFFLFIIWLFCVSIAVGVLVQPANIVLFLNDYLNTLFSQIDGMNFLELLIYIFRNNVLTSFIGMIFGVFLGFYPLISIFINGYVS